MSKFLVLACIVASACAFTKSMPLMSRSKLAMSKQLETPRIAMSLETSSLAQVSQTLAGVVAVDGGTIGLDVQFGAFLAIILGLLVPCVFLVTLYIQSEAQGTAVSFRQPDSIGGALYEDE